MPRQTWDPPLSLSISRDARWDFEEIQFLLSRDNKLNFFTSIFNEKLLISFYYNPTPPPLPKKCPNECIFLCLVICFFSIQSLQFKICRKFFLVIMVGRPETRRLSASISWDAFRKGRSLARNHISICFFLTFQLTKAEELPTLCIEKPELTKTEFSKLLQCWVAEVGGTWDRRSPKACGICEWKEILWFVTIYALLQQEHDN